MSKQLQIYCRLSINLRVLHCQVGTLAPLHVLPEVTRKGDVAK